MPSPKASPFHALVAAVAVSTAAALLTGCGSDAETQQPAPPPTLTARDAAVQSDLDTIVDAGVAGMIATLTADGHTTTLTSGVSNLGTAQPFPQNAQVRIGSITKSFTAAILMQLVSEGKANLDDPIDTYLPAMVSGDGVDGRNITVRRILQHRSGLPEFAGDPRTDELIAAAERRTVSPDEALSVALEKPAQFPPGTEYKYTNTNYLIAGILIEKITGNSYSDELSQRIFSPLDLEDTYLPVSGELDIRGPHPTGYEKDNDGVVTDVSQIEPSVPWAAGAIVSTGTDLNTFFLRLLDGTIIEPDQLAQMEQFLSTGDGQPGYGIGIDATDLSCGARLIGHTGSIPGYHTISGATDGGRAATITFTQAPGTQPDILGLLAHAICDK